MTVYACCLPFYKKMKFKLLLEVHCVSLLQCCSLGKLTMAERHFMFYFPYIRMVPYHFQYWSKYILVKPVVHFTKLYSIIWLKKNKHQCKTNYFFLTFKQDRRTLATFENLISFRMGIKELSGYNIKILLNALKSLYKIKKQFLP